MYKKIRNSKFAIRNYNRGMTYVELIVVLSIFAVMSAIVMYNYGAFQAKVDIKNLASDIALKIVEAQKSSLSGNLPPNPESLADTWKPSYGVSFNSSEAGSGDANNTPFNKKFTYFVDNNLGNIEVLDTIDITKNNFIKDLLCDGVEVNILDITFKRPDSRAIMDCTSNAEIVVSGPSGAQAKIVVHPSGRIQVD